MGKETASEILVRGGAALGLVAGLMWALDQPTQTVKCPPQPARGTLRRKARQTILNNHHAKLVLAGQSDQARLDLVSNLLGDQPLEQRSISRGDDRRTETTSTTFRRLASADVVRQQQRGQGILTYGSLPPARIELLPWFVG